MIMWSYYGAKTNLIPFYPAPRHDKIIEPFAGSARYALRYFEKDVLLIDKYPTIIKIWKWLQSCSEKDVLSLPRKMTFGQTLEEFTFDCEEAKLFMGFIIGCGAERPRIKATERKTTMRPNHINYNLKRIANQLFKIRHWEFLEADYSVAPNIEATWFIDPPYEFGGAAYVYNKVNYAELSEWSQTRKGQIIICENTKATWMNFKPIVQRGSLKTTTEAIWCNSLTPYHTSQLQMFQKQG
jgi:hypothetical protein